MSILDEIKKLTHPYEDEDDDPAEFEDELQERDMFEERRSRYDDRRNKVVNIHATTQLKVVLVKPERFENASEIADQLKDKRTVVLNLESTNKDVAGGSSTFSPAWPMPERARSKKWLPTPILSPPTTWTSRGT